MLLVGIRCAYGVQLALELGNRLGGSGEFGELPHEWMGGAGSNEVMIRQPPVHSVANGMCGACTLWQLRGAGGFKTAATMWTLSDHPNPPEQGCLATYLHECLLRRLP